MGPSPGRVKSKAMKSVLFVPSPLSMQLLGVRVGAGWHGFRIMSESGATCLPVDLFQRASTKYQ